jgi:3-phosphoshikimate 1-carboxyvinyltransferase
VPADKSMSHRALILGALACGESRIDGLLEAKDVMSTRECLVRLGARIEKLAPGSYRVIGSGAEGLVEPQVDRPRGEEGRRGEGEE